MKLFLTRAIVVLTLVCASLFDATVSAQNISVADGLTANEMVTILLGETNATISNAQFTGSVNSSGSFNQMSAEFPFSDGVLLTTGLISNAVGPNTSNSISSVNGTVGDADLNTLVTGSQTYDAAVLEFDITSNCSLLSIEYLFSSEEYLEAGCNSFNDVFAFFISGPGYTVPTNIALIPGTTIPVSAQSIINNASNCVSNPNLYVNNPIGSQGIEYDGRTTVLTAEAVIQACQTYHIKIVIADTENDTIDSGIFLRRGGVYCSNYTLTASADISNAVCGSQGSININLMSGTGPFTYQWVGPNGFTASTQDISELSPGEYHVQITGADCLSTGAFTYTVLNESNSSDIQAPTITCPPQITLSLDPETCSLSTTTIDIGTPVATDNCMLVSVTNNLPPSFQAGLNAVIWTAIDGQGNTELCKQKINVVDNEPPTIICPADTSVFADDTRCSASKILIGLPAITDNCSISSFINDAPNQGIYPVGSTPVTWTATDVFGNTSTCIQTITVIDNEDPKIVCNPIITVETDADLCTASNVSLGTIKTTDNCSIFSLVNDAPDTYPIGSTMVTSIVMDGSGNTATCMQEIIVLDEEKPSISCPPVITVGTDLGICAASNVALGMPITGDNCSVISIINNAPPSFSIGVSAITWTVTDASGNTRKCKQKIIVEDFEAPTIICPPDVIVSADSSACTASNISLGVPTATDNCSTISFTNDLPNPPVFPIGSTTVTWTATDESGNSSICTQIVTVMDDIHPEITCNPTIESLTDSASCTSTIVELETVNTSDNCAVASLVNDAPAVYPVGVTIVTWTVSDAAGNTATCVQEITVINPVSDTIPPTIACPTDITIDLPQGTCNGLTVVLGTPTTSDNCTVFSVTNNAPVVFPIGATNVTWTVEDASGNTTSCIQVVTIVDNENPTIICPIDIIVDVDSTTCAASNVTLETPLVSDNCSVVSVMNDAPISFPIGITTVTWTATDAAGNSTSCSQIVTVEDHENPTIECSANLIANVDPGSCVSSNVVLENPTIFDNCTIVSVTNDAPISFPIGTTTVTWTVTDNAGNTASCPQMVTIEDNENPTIECPADITVNSVLCDASNVVLGTPVTSDNCSIVSITNNAPSTYPIGSTTVIWTAVDSSGNTSTCAQIVTIIDNQNPTVICSSDVIVNTDPDVCGASNVMLGTPTTSDNCSVASITNNAPNTFPIGSTTVTWTATDASGNIATCSQVVNVIDTIIPTISCPVQTNRDVDAGTCTATNVTLGTPLVSDNCALASLSNNAPVHYPIGLTPVTWTAMDSSGNMATCMQNVMIEDNQNPTIICPADITANSTACSSSTIILGIPTTADNCTVTSVTNDAPIAFPLGTTTVTWTVMDAAGNMATCSQLVTVEDNEAPTITCSAPLTVTVDLGSCAASSVSLETPLLSDNCTIASITNDAPALFPIGSTSVTWTVTDSSGNISTCAQEVLVIDTIKPMISCSADIMINVDSGMCSASDVILLTPIVSDNCMVTILSDDAPSVFPIGSTIVTWTVIDAAGNMATCPQIVTVEDNEDPIITCPTDLIVNVTPGTCSSTNVTLGTPIVNDNCTIASLSNDAPTNFPLGTTTVIWTVTDASGNMATCSQAVTVEDNENPIAICKNITITLDDSGTTSITSMDIDGGSTDNCGIQDMSISQTTFSCEDSGVNDVILTVTDNSGNTSTCIATVTVTGNSFLTLNCPGDQIFDCNLSCGIAGAFIQWEEPTASSFSSCNNGCSPDTDISGFIYMGEYNGSRYYCSSSSTYTWEDANLAATNAGGYLASIQTAGENQFIGSQIMASVAWIGYTDENTEGIFEWTNGDSTTFTNWYSSEPNNNGPSAPYSGGNASPTCGPADYTVISSSNTQWYDRRPCNLNEFVMEIPCGNSITIAQTAGPTNGSRMYSGNSDVVTYVATDNVTGETTSCSFTVSVLDCPPEYCESAGSCTAYEWIEAVSIGSISNNSGNDGGYGDYTNQINSVQTGDVIDLQLTPGFSSNTWEETWRVWVDWNYDGDFYDQGELVYEDQGLGTMSGSFTVPYSAISNNLRVRVSMRWNSYAAPCSNFNYGEVEDYTINVSSNPIFKTFINEDVARETTIIKEISSVGNGLELTPIYPNPVLSANGIVTFDLRTVQDEELTINVLDLAGNIVRKNVLFARKGVNTNQLDVKGLVAGTYIIEISTGNGKEIAKLIVH